MINDEIDLLEVCKIVLERAGHIVQILTSGASAVGVAEQFRPDVILLDWVMPDCTGDVVMAHLRATGTTAHIPVVLVSALAGLRRLGKRIGADDVLGKPFTIAELENKIAQVLGKAHSEAPTG